MITLLATILILLAVACVVIVVGGLLTIAWPVMLVIGLFVLIDVLIIRKLFKRR